MDKYNVGDIISGVVTGIEDYGIFLSIEDNITGLIHISELSDSFVRDVGEYANMNENIKAKIIEIDKENRKMKLSVKNLEYRDVSNDKHRIVETKKGFSSLSTKLEEWIADKQEEML